MLSAASRCGFFEQRDATVKQEAYDLDHLSRLYMIAAYFKRTSFLEGTMHQNRINNIDQRPVLKTRACHCEVGLIMSAFTADKSSHPPLYLHLTNFLEVELGNESLEHTHMGSSRSR